MWKEKLEEILKFGKNHLELISNKNHSFIDKNNDFIIFGASAGGAKAKSFLDKLDKKIAYFVDNDINKKGKIFLGKVIKHPNEISMFEHKIIIASDWWYEIKKQLEERYTLVAKFDFYWNTNTFTLAKMELNNTQENFLSCLESNLDKYTKVFDLLEDETSKATYFRVLKGRIFYGQENPNFPPMPKVHYNQYFHPQVKPENGDIIVDAGAYIGDTIEEIVKERIDYKKVYAFEPDEQTYNKLIENTTKYKDIECYSFGLWDRTDKLHFLANGDISSAIAKNPDEANQIIDVISLDGFFKDKEKPTLIKMDIEGAEFEALLGAKEIITQHKPKLQICTYHKPEHLWQIPMLLKEWVADYKFYIGHHNWGSNDTVLYAKV